MISMISSCYYNSSDERKTIWFRKSGCKIGKGNRFNCKLDFMASEPYLVEIGDNNLFAGGCRLVTHDGGVKVLNTLGYFNGKQMDKMGRIKIGSNVFLGLDTIVMPNVIIGDNVIVGARSIVSKNIPSNSVAIGSPAKVICTIEEYYKRNIEKTVFFEIPSNDPQIKSAFLTKIVPEL